MKPKTHPLIIPLLTYHSPSSLPPTLRQSPPFIIALIILIITKPLILQRKHRLTIQTLAWKRGGFLRDWSREGGGVAVVGATLVAGEGSVGRWFGSVGLGVGVRAALLEVFAQVEGGAGGEVEAVVVLGDL